VLTLMLGKEDLSEKWSDNSTQAPMDFQDFIGIPEKDRTAYLEPNDPYRRLFNLCKCARVLLPVPYRKRGAEALLHFFHTAQESKIPYAWSAISGVPRVA
jgi:hypothetical protein